MGTRKEFEAGLASFIDTLLPLLQQRQKNSYAAEQQRREEEAKKALVKMQLSAEAERKQKEFDSQAALQRETGPLAVERAKQDREIGKMKSIEEALGRILALEQRGVGGGASILDQPMAQAIMQNKGLDIKELMDARRSQAEGRRIEALFPSEKQEKEASALEKAAGAEERFEKAETERASRPGGVAKQSAERGKLVAEKLANEALARQRNAQAEAAKSLANLREAKEKAGILIGIGLKKHEQVNKEYMAMAKAVDQMISDGYPVNLVLSQIQIMNTAGARIGVPPMAYDPTSGSLVPDREGTAAMEATKQKAKQLIASKVETPEQWIRFFLQQTQGLDDADRLLDFTVGVQLLHEVKGQDFVNQVLKLYDDVKRDFKPAPPRVPMAPSHGPGIPGAGLAPRSRGGYSAGSRRSAVFPWRPRSYD